MKNPQYIIKNLDKDNIIKWDNKKILFDSQEEAEEYVEILKGCFQIIKGVFLGDFINYKTLKERKDFKNWLNK